MWYLNFFKRPSHRSPLFLLLLKAWQSLVEFHSFNLIIKGILKPYIAFMFWSGIYGVCLPGQQVPQVYNKKNHSKHHWCFHTNQCRLSSRDWWSAQFAQPTYWLLFQSWLLNATSDRALKLAGWTLLYPKYKGQMERHCGCCFGFAPFCGCSIC